MLEAVIWKTQAREMPHHAKAQAGQTIARHTLSMYTNTHLYMSIWQLRVHGKCLESGQRFNQLRDPNAQGSNSCAVCRL